VKRPHYPFQTTTKIHYTVKDQFSLLWWTNQDCQEVIWWRRNQVFLNLQEIQLPINMHVTDVEDHIFIRPPWWDIRDMNVASLHHTHANFVAESSREGTYWKDTWKSAWVNQMCHHRTPTPHWQACQVLLALPALQVPLPLLQQCHLYHSCLRHQYQTMSLMQLSFRHDPNS